MRIVSLVPSWSEWLCDLGKEPVGVTSFCTRPKGLKDRAQRIGGTKKIDVDRINALNPDLVIASKEENVKEQVEALNAPVLATDVRTVSEAWETMLDIADIVERSSVGKDWVDRIQQAWGEPRQPRVQASYVIWKSPWMVAGGGTYIHHVLQWWGIENAHGNRQRYPQVQPEELAQIVLLSSEPFPFGHLHLNEPDLQERKAFLVNGEACSWYGSRMWHAWEELDRLAIRIEEAVTG